ncbi:MAG: glycosyl hydrolase [Candidatus Bathyarchaeia archaeon]|jgi:hypothetical protein
MGMPILQSSVIAQNTQANSTQATVPTMINGVVCHQLNAQQAQLLTSNGVDWVSADISFGGYDESNWNTIYNLAQTYHLKVLGILDTWTMNFTTFTLPQWIAAVNQSVTQYGSGISAWEIWNEPCFTQNYLGVFQGLPSQYVELMSTAYPIIKAAYPNAIVLGLGGLPLYTSIEGPSNNTTWVQYSLNFTQQVVALGGMNYCDAISLHAYPYGSLTNYVKQNWSQSLSQYEAITGKDVWITETGQESVGEPTPWSNTKEQSNYMIASYPLFRSLGVKAYFWYELQDNNSFTDYTFGLYNVKGTAKPTLGTYFSLLLPTQTSSPSPNTTSSPTPEFPTFIAVAIVLIVAIAGILSYKKKRMSYSHHTELKTEKLDNLED